MSQFNLPSISLKKGAVVLGVLALIIVVLYSVGSGRHSLQSSLQLSGGGVAAYGAPTMGIAPAYDSVQNNYGEKGMAYRDEMSISESSIAPQPPIPGQNGGAPSGE